MAGVVYPDNPQILGPLQINKDKYLLGENIYVILKDLRPKIKGSILFMTPENVFMTNGDLMEMKENFKKNILNHNY